jgi:hypothetical protein
VFPYRYRGRLWIEVCYDGECPSPYEFDMDSLIEEFRAEELQEILRFYPKFKEEELGETGGDQELNNRR